jgi:hypothetical protein
MYYMLVSLILSGQSDITFIKLEFVNNTLLLALIYQFTHQANKTVIIKYIILYLYRSWIVGIVSITTVGEIFYGVLYWILFVLRVQ